VPDVLTIEHLESMNPDPIIFAMANPDPEIRPEVAVGKARIIATGRSDYPNQINNVLCFPGIFRGALDVRAREIDEPMKLAAAEAMAGVIPVEDLSEDYIIPRSSTSGSPPLSQKRSPTGPRRRARPGASRSGPRPA
jgi:malate dehydrogenase (oxaloacetate-decarboxylating)